MGSVKFDYSKVIGFIKQHEIDCMQSYVDQAHKMIHEKTGLGNDFLGWVDLPKNYNKEEFSRIKKAAEKVKSDSDVLLVIGIGGSYLGARAAIEMASHSFRNNLSKEDRKSPEIYFVGQNISSTYMMDLLDVIKDKDVSINVISKSGTTTEPAIAFRIFKEFLEKNHVTGVIEEEGNCTKLILKGKSAHASLPEEGINAVSLLATYLDGIINNKLVHFIATYLNDYDGKGLQINHEGLMGKLTMNLGVVRYVKEKAEIELDLRCPHEIDLKKMADDVEELCHSYGLTLESDIHEPLYVDPNSELIQKLHKAYVEVSGDTTSAPQAIGGGTYAKSMPNCVAFGCEFKGEDNAIHGNNENIKVDSLLKSTEIFAKAIYDLIKE